MKTKYPRLGASTKVPKHKNPKCKCGKRAEYYIDIQYTCMRGDDDVAKACSEHKNDINFLLGKNL